VTAPRRLRHLPRLAGTEIRRADDPLARLLGLAGLRELPDGSGLLLPRTRSIHTLGMRFPLDLVWLDRDGRVVRVDRGVRPWRMRVCRGASAVMELPSRADA
jgi:uncharacterized protein